MADSTVTFSELRDELREFVRERDWERFHNPKDLAMALSVEASELLEHFLWRGPAASIRTPARRQAIADELADVLIYGLHIANALDIDVSEAVLHKIAMSAEKYPTDRFKGRAREPGEGGRP